MFYEPKKGYPFNDNPFAALVFPRPIGWVSSLSKNCIPAQARVLVIGCRNNTILKNMAKIFNELIICDISIEHVRKINMMLKEKQNSIVYENNGKDLSIFTDNYFDFCYSFEQLKFVPD